jgi:alkylresorcinol/alkylpyrone synthase
MTMHPRQAPAVPRLAALATALPPHVVHQGEARDLAHRLFDGVVGRDARLLQVFEHAGIATRHVCMPLDWYERDHDFAEKNACYLEHAVRLAGEAACAALRQAGLGAAEVDHLVFISSTGIATPSVDARLANLLGCRPEVRRTPIWGLGCAGGAGGLARAREFAIAAPGSRVLLVALELCSLTFQRHDLSTRNLVAASLFADGAAAALVTTRNGAQAPGLELVGSSSTLWPDTLDVMGWDVDGEGLHVIFSRDIPTLVRERLRASLEGFLAGQGLAVESLGHLVAHPGGAKVLRALEEALALGPEALRHAREVLRACGNMSAPTCLFVLERFLVAGAIRPGEYALLTALGPGFTAEHVLMRGAAA